MPPLHVLIKPASGLCNLRCRYCFYHDVAQNRQVPSYGVMSEAMLETVIRKALDFAQGECTIAFQGGEPTLAGLEFFQAVVRLQRRHNTKGLPIHNAIQTNGYGLGEDWARFFAENRFLVGLSLDGRLALHDRNRIDAKGNGTFAQVMDTARLFRERGVEFNILAVVSRHTAARAAEVYAFFKKNGFRFLQFIPCLDPLGEPFGGKAYSLTPQLYGKFLCELYDLWRADLLRGDGVSIRDFDNYAQMAAGYPPESCNLRGVCGLQNVVEADGSVYPCDFYVLDEMRLGNLADDDFAQLYRRREEMGFVEKSTRHDDGCKNCRFFAMCRGGCMRHREAGKSYFCEAYRALFEHAGEGFAQIARAAGL